MVLVMMTVRSVSVRAGDIFTHILCFHLKQRVLGIPKSDGFVSVESGTFLPPSWEREESTSRSKQTLCHGTGKAEPHPGAC